MHTLTHQSGHLLCSKLLQTEAKLKQRTWAMCAQFSCKTMANLVPCRVRCSSVSQGINVQGMFLLTNWARVDPTGANHAWPVGPLLRPAAAATVMGDSWMGQCMADRLRMAGSADAGMTAVEPGGMTDLPEKCSASWPSAMHHTDCSAAPATATI